MSEPTCAINDCLHPLGGRGWCGAHYRRWRLYGDPLSGPPMRRRQDPKAVSCQVEQCPEQAHSTGLCRRHYDRQRSGIPLDAPLRKVRPKGSPRLTECQEPFCELPYAARGYCARHYSVARRAGVFPERKCSVKGCPRGHSAKGYCQGHYARVKRGENPATLGPLRASPNTTRRVVNGYASHKINGKYILEHRLVMEAMLGRTLLPGENVHHRNGVRDDNRPSNLEVWVTSQPSGQRVEDVVAHAQAMLARYAPHLLH